MSETQASVLSLIRGDFDRNHVEVVPKEEWNSILSEFESSRMFPLAYSRISAASTVLDQNEESKNLYAFYKSRVDHYIEAIRSFASIAEQLSLRFVLFKGMALSELIYEDVYARQANDIDILVSQDDLAKANYVARTAGFIQPTDHIVSFDARRDLNPSPYPFRRHQDDIQLSPYYAFYGGFSIKMEIHMGLRIGEGKSSSEEYYWKTQKIGVAGMCMRTFDIERTFLMLMVNAYENSETIYSNQTKDKVIFRDYADIHFFLNKYRDRIIWRTVKESMEHNGLVSAVSQAINSLSELYADDGVHLRRVLSIQGIASIWENPFVERVFSREKRTLIKEEGLKSIFSSDEETAEIPLEGKEALYKSHLGLDGSIFIQLVRSSPVSRKSLDFTWILNSVFADEETLVFQVSFYVDSPKFTSLRYEFNTFADKGTWFTFGSKKEKIGFGASREANGEEFITQCQDLEDGKRVTFSIPLTSFGLSDLLVSGQMRITPCVFKNNIGKEFYLVFQEKPCIYSICQYALE